MIHFILDIGLGTFPEVQWFDLFYKVTPPAANTEALSNFGMSLEEYAAHFWKTDDGESQGEAAVENHVD